MAASPESDIIIWQNVFPSVDPSLLSHVFVTQSSLDLLPGVMKIALVEKIEKWTRFYIYFLLAEKNILFCLINSMKIKDGEIPLRGTNDVLKRAYNIRTGNFFVYSFDTYETQRS